MHDSLARVAARNAHVKRIENLVAVADLAEEALSLTQLAALLDVLHTVISDSSQVDEVLLVVRNLRKNLD